MSPRPAAAVRYTAIALLGVLVVGYLLALFVTRGIWVDQDGMRITLAAQMRDGSSPSPDALSQAVTDVQARLANVGVTDAEVAAEDNNVVATFARDELGPDTVKEMFAPAGTKALHIRPVVHSIQAKPEPDAPPVKPTAGDEAQRIADEKQLRQSTEQQIQLLALQFQATRCDGDDALTGHDDPTLPLVTCSTDGDMVYLLDKSIIGGDHVRNSTPRYDSDLGQYLVELEFDETATRTWADYTATHVDTQTAFTLDTHVVSAPQIAETIPNGRTQIFGRLDRDNARALADTIMRGASPVSVTFVSSTDELIPPTSLVQVLRVVMIAAGVGLALLAVGAAVYLRRRS